MKCPRCGAEVPDISKFCLECGSVLTSVSADKKQPLQTDKITADSQEEASTGSDITSVYQHSESEPCEREDEASWAFVKPLNAQGDAKFEPLDQQLELGEILKTMSNLAKTRVQNVSQSCTHADVEVAEQSTELEDDAENAETQNAEPEVEAPDYAGVSEWLAMHPDAEVVDAQAIEPNRKNQTSKLPFIAGGVALAILAIVVVTNLFSFFCSPYAINSETFPDEGLRAALLEFDDDGDGYITRDQAAQITELTVPSAQDISGLGIFPNLASITAQGAMLTNVDVSDLKALTVLDLGNNPVNTLNLSGCTNLQSLTATQARMEALSLNDMTQLENLQVGNSSIESLDLTNCTNLQFLDCPQNCIITGLDTTMLEETWVITSYSATVPTSANKATRMRITSTYNDYGDIESVTYNTSEDGSGDIKYVYTNGLITEANQYPVESNSESFAWSIAYGEGGRVASMENATTGVVYSYSYDEAGRVAYSNFTGRKGIERYYAYDELNRLIGYTGDEHITIAYDEAGNLTGYYTEDGSYQFWFTYDSAGNIVQAYIVLGSYGSCVETFEYDENGKLINATRTLGDDARYSFPLQAITSAQFEYDANGNITSAKLINADNLEQSCTIKYQRVFTSNQIRSAGCAPVLGDPLLICQPSQWYWMPWTYAAQDQTNLSALTLAFNPNSVWHGNNYPYSSYKVEESGEDTEGSAAYTNASD